MTPSRKSASLDGIMAFYGLGLICQAVVSCIPEDAGERLAAGVDPQQIADETMGRVLRKYSPAVAPGPQLCGAIPLIPMADGSRPGCTIRRGHDGYHSWAVAS